MRILGIDPGLQKCGWGVVEQSGSSLKHIANGVVKSKAKDTTADRLLQIHTGLSEVIELWRPDEFAIEETFVNKNPLSSLKLGQARGTAIVTAGLAGLPVSEYAANLVKKSIVGAGHADKAQIMMMVKTLLPGAEVTSEDAADALAVAITHANHRNTFMV